MRGRQDSLLLLSVLQCVAVCCSVLQRVAACCSVLQRFAACVCYIFPTHERSLSDARTARFAVVIKTATRITTVSLVAMPYSVPVCICVRVRVCVREEEGERKCVCVCSISQGSRTRRVLQETESAGEI